MAIGWRPPSAEGRGLPRPLQTSRVSRGSALKRSSFQQSCRMGRGYRERRTWEWSALGNGWGEADSVYADDEAGMRAGASHPPIGALPKRAYSPVVRRTTV